ncbi:4066_t:CDS:2 [Paraglomus brasilianum]|uniref:4066_t:CDS:1 n=1 Tax=Paraglomus brasilianum TaxID=144538 RepID=A0A9N9AP91_9GLOM|nr:4066_t:CDS:2 [Paraglomus brasilianum]
MSTSGRISTCSGVYTAANRPTPSPSRIAYDSAKKKGVGLEILYPAEKGGRA